ncbi:hypothetical protein [Ewingella americana]|uniref:hypothetical protein n=1 Tax=Ewingella americana TaxID=41202 RepID=UPI00163A8421|nr:hypothetical protein [Ewingella americana]QMV50935.1 hypothetical protein GXP68_05890 [Ewingella americana]
MKNSMQKYVTEELLRATKPLSCAELAAIIGKKVVDFVPTNGGVSVVIQRLKILPDFKVTVHGENPRQKYTLRRTKTAAVDLHALVRHEFETRLWAVRAARGQA